MTTGLDGDSTLPPAPQELPLPRLFSESAHDADTSPETAAAEPGEAAGDDVGAPDPVTTDDANDAQSERSLESTLAELSERLPRRRTRGRIPLRQQSRSSFTPEQRLLLLDTWQRSNLPARDFASLVSVSQYTLYNWKQRFEAEGPAGLCDRLRGREPGSRLPEPTRRAILMLKQAHPEWGQDRLHDVLMRSQGFQASPNAIGRLLEESGYVVTQTSSEPHPQPERRFERARPNQLWQTDLFTFVLKREARRVYLVAFLDDHSRFVVGYGLHASASGALVREVFEAAVTNFGLPEEVLTDNGTQYHTWRGKSEFTRLLERRGVKQIVARPRHPETLGKIERFWGTLWRECLERAVFRGLEDARRRIGWFIDHYNFERTHTGVGGLVPADRFFAAAPQVLATLKQRVAANALLLAQQGEPRKPFYLTGRVGDVNISLHAEGQRVVLTREGGAREEVDLSAEGRSEAEPGATAREPVTPVAKTPSPGIEHPGELPAPGTSPLDDALGDLADGLRGGGSES